MSIERRACVGDALARQVAGNLRHFPKRVAGTTPILTPAQFVTLAGSESPDPTTAG